MSKLLERVRGLVRSWYGNLPVRVLVMNKSLQKKIMEFESLCSRKMSRESCESAIAREVNL